MPVKTPRPRNTRRLPTGRVDLGSKSALGVLRGRTRGTRMVADGGVVELREPNLILSKLAGHPKQDPFRAGDYLHVSDLLKRCVRQVALSYSTGTKLVGQQLWDNSLITFAIGNSIQSFVTSKLTITAASELYGGWSCVCGQSSIAGTASEAKNADDCNVCGKGLTQYREVVLLHEDLKISGSVDLMLLFDGAYYLTEIKSIKKENWEALTRPQPEHILQVVFYWWLARELRLPLHRQVSVLYVNKSFAFSSPYKEFTIDPMDHLHRLTDYIEDARALVAARAGGPLPVRICPTKNSPQAKTCELCSVCFSREG